MYKYLKEDTKRKKPGFFYFWWLPVPGQETVGTKWNTGGSI